MYMGSCIGPLFLVGGKGYTRIFIFLDYKNLFLICLWADVVVWKFLGKVKIDRQ